MGYAIGNSSRHHLFVGISMDNLGNSEGWRPCFENRLHPLIFGKPLGATMKTSRPSERMMIQCPYLDPPKYHKKS